MNSKPGPDELLTRLVAALDEDDHARTARTARELRAYCDNGGRLAQWLSVGPLLDALAQYAAERHERAPRELLDVFVDYAGQAFDRWRADPRPLLSPAAERERFRSLASERFAQPMSVLALDPEREAALPFEPDEVPRAARRGEALPAAFRSPARRLLLVPRPDVDEPEPEQDRDPIYCVACASVAVGLDALGRPTCASCAQKGGR